MLLSLIFGFSASAGSVLFSHWLSLAVTMLSQSITVGAMCHDARSKGILWRRHGPLVLCVLSTPFLLLNIGGNLMEDTHLERGGPKIDRAVSASAWVGSGGVLVAVIWNTGLLNRLQGAWNGQDWEACGS